jgi:carbamoyl-phosphate synthase small subunit
MWNGTLILEDGTTVYGNYIGPHKTIFAEIVFNTSMTGYQEAFTDPSYAGQILVMTYPLIGNYGIHHKYSESAKVQIRGLVVKEPCFASQRGTTFARFLQTWKIPCLYNVDTRALTLKIRSRGTMKALLTSERAQRQSTANLIAQLKARAHPDTDNLVGTVSCRHSLKHTSRQGKKLVLIDCGVKKSILTHLRYYATVIQVPYDASSKTILKQQPCCVVISNGPGNPEHSKIRSTTIKTISQLIGKVPLFGICLGHQLLGIALGFSTYKMKFGHRGSNHAVKHLPTNRVFITSQNHGYALRRAHVKNCEVEWVNVNDNTIEGLRHRTLPIFSVQFHPEAAPGPHDTSFLFKNFLEECTWQDASI